MSQKSKMKTNKAVAKRFKFTGSGRIRFKRANLQHNTGYRRTRETRALRKPAYLRDEDRYHIWPHLPYGNR